MGVNVGVEHKSIVSDIRSTCWSLRERQIDKHKNNRGNCIGLIYFVSLDLWFFSVVPKGKWAIAGHSAGGFANTEYAAEFGDRIYAVVMHAGGWSANFTENPLPIAQIYGTLDDISPGGYDRYRYEYTDPPPKGKGPLVNLKTSKFVPIEGANHHQVGDYGYQSPDQIATISMEQQVAKFATETVSFLEDVASGKIVAQ